jgi:hypothetical protein
MHHLAVCQYRRELTISRPGLKRSRLVTLIARAKVLAEDEGWAPTPDEMITLEQ